MEGKNKQWRAIFYCDWRMLISMMLAWLLVLFFSSSAHALIQRSLINLGFEQPTLPSNSCYVQIDDDNVPGWITTHTPVMVVVAVVVLHLKMVT